ncbi:DUF3558 domain-containing protein [Streptomyces sp. NBC_00053]|uniref:DUF3558 domain-containing protein n=1 Tax=unclassified Streptomyces TaxID=2593676 RepID=UPI002251F93E|nr:MULTISPECIES: DUF3558 domain-containing protein [unclassified Streptomyces]MCX4395936.1 DUF3558 domain-containing protein [Streptomyces sp. NBC_01767]MCX5101432.1 DUF3558 domain-containing protein [Streptomyces sp. NBC_00439]MCX5160957.1 DUF3558 domain-containing protein [Streptomyces sp. NBC_00305]MCX5219480.1 DUF3558 domain-containing protein [Streptomyces sp. NBC_00264]MCX5501219.1 DUF3558 domain-containing protein [Streptomyces sp. NBC_00052]
MAFVTGTALLAALVVGCSADSGTDGSAADSKPGEETVAAAAPGKYRTLPEPCRAVETSTLKDLLPGAAELTEEQQQKVYGGTASVTYDTDRRVGCGWKSEDPSSSHTLFIDFERVVSYDPAVSDDDRAREVYTKKETAAGLSSPSATPDAAKSTENAADKEKGAEKDAGKDAGKKQTSAASDDASDPTSHALSGPTPEDDSTDTATDPSTGGENTDDGTGTPDESLQPRVLDDLGDSAFLDDLLTRAGSTAQHRTVKVVFRTSNVIVTVEYAEQPTVSTMVPDSEELQEKAQALARKLVEKFSE